MYVFDISAVLMCDVIVFFAVSKNVNSNAIYVIVQSMAYIENLGFLMCMLRNAVYGCEKRLGIYRLSCPHESLVDTHSLLKGLV